MWFGANANECCQICGIRVRYGGEVDHIERVGFMQETQPSRQISASESWCIGPAVSSQKAKEMPGDPNRRREHARSCAEIARHTASPEVRDHFTSLEQSWLHFAAEIESGQKLLDLIGEISRDLVPIAEAAE
jgi:hypothetical protein